MDTSIAFFVKFLLADKEKDITCDRGCAGK